jgi:hypothetical protein
VEGRKEALEDFTSVIGFLADGLLKVQKELVRFQKGKKKGKKSKFLSLFRRK